MKLKLLTVGRLSASYLQEGSDEFEKRIRRYMPLEIEEIKEDKSGGKKGDPAQIRRNEGEKLLARVPNDAFVIVLDERGRDLSSKGISALLEKHMVQGTSHLVWVIGGPYGLSDAVKQRANLQLSLSAMTFTHQMARLFLLEQVYRGFTILRNEPYHNE